LKLDPQNEQLKELMGLYEEVYSESENNQNSSDEEEDKNGVKLKKNKYGEYCYEDSENEEDLEN